MDDILIHDWDDNAEASLRCHICGITIRRPTWRELMHAALMHRNDCTDPQHERPLEQQTQKPY